jgi:hypothetical protein
MDFVSIAYGAVQILSPFLPTLIKLGKSFGEHLEEFAADKVSEQAKKLWNKITGRYKDDKVLEARATIVADSPEDENSKREFSKRLAEHLANDEAFAKEILDTIGGPKRLQEIIGGDSAIVERIHQEMQGAGVQRVQAGTGARISDVTQKQTE